MNIKRTQNKDFDSQVELTNFDEHLPCPTKDKDKNVVDKIEIAYSKETDNFYLSGDYANPTDSYGDYWEITDSGCISLTNEELSSLIAELQYIQNKRNELKVKGN